MPKRKYIKVCDQEPCDYLPCVEERIAQLEDQGLDSGALRTLADQIREADARMWESESDWLATLDFQNARV